MLLLNGSFIFFQCQSDKPPMKAADTVESVRPTEPADGEKMERVVTAVESALQATQAVRASLRALPAAVQAANEVLLDRLRNDLEGMEEKQSIIRDRLTSITRPEQARKTDATLSDDQISATVPPTSAEVDDFNQSIERYRAAIQEMESQISQLKAGKQQ